MITVKILCGCGQKYAFDVEPYNGRMPSTVQCPICKTDGTAAANEILARTLPPAPAPQPVAPVQHIAPPAASSLRIGGTAATAHAEAPAAPPPPRAATPGGMSAAQRSKLQAELKEGAGGTDDKWKWWYYILIGVGIAGYDIWLAYDQQRLKPLGGLFLSVVLIAIGIWDFNRKRAIKRQLRGR